MPVFGIISVRHYRFRKDDGSETTATWYGAEDAQVVVPLAGSDVNFELRLGIDESSPGATDTCVYGLQVSRNVGAAANVTPSSTYVKGVDSANLTDGGNTTQQLTVPPGDTYVTKAGVADNVNCQSASIALANAGDGSQCTEVQFSMVLTAADLAAGDTLDFTLRRISGDSPTLSQFPSSVRLTIAAGLGGSDHPPDVYGPILRAPAPGNPLTFLRPFGEEEIKFVLLGEEEYTPLRLAPPAQNAMTFFRPFIGDAGEIAGLAAGFALIARLKDWIQVQNANYWCACRVQCNAAFRLNLLGRQDREDGPSYIFKQASSTTITVDGATAGYTEEVDIDIPWPAIGRLEVWAPAGTLYNSDVRMYYKRRNG